ncbi:FecR family protein [Pedobacter sp. PWIIR3]
MNNQIKRHFLEILYRYNRGIASSTEQKFLESFYDLHEHSDDLIIEANEKDYLVLKNDIRTGIQQKAGYLQRPGKSLKLKLWVRYAGVAAVLLVMFGSLFIFTKQTSNADAIANADKFIKPGGNNAILTLANGKKILLNTSNTGRIAIQSGVSIVKTADGLITYQVSDQHGDEESNLINTITTPSGGQYAVLLPDGSRVQLNASSTLSFPTQFKSNERVLSLQGEAYFEVAKQPGRPFRVLSGDHTVEVLGTHFNINAYKDEAGIRTTLIEGSVKVSQDTRTEFLKPGQQLLAVPGRQFVKRDVEVEKYIAWKNGLFNFENDDIKSVMRQIARWYDVDVKYEGNVSGLEFSGDLFRTSKLSSVLNILELNNVHCELNGRTITVSYKE